MNHGTVRLHLSQHRNSAALPPTGLWGEGLTADGWADTGGIWFIGWVSICGLRIWVSNTFTLFYSVELFTQSAPNYDSHSLPSRSLCCQGDESEKGKGKTVLGKREKQNISISRKSTVDCLCIGLFQDTSKCGKR